MKGLVFGFVGVLLAGVCFGEYRGPGVVIAHSPQSSGVYIGSPGIASLGGGVYLAKHVRGFRGLVDEDLESAIAAFERRLQSEGK